MPGASRRILLFGKTPRPGAVKTRLAPLLGEAGAARLYQAFLEDAAALVRRVPGAAAELWLEPPPRTVGREVGRAGCRSAAGIARLLGFEARHQEGEGLGERLRRAFGRAFEEGCGAAVAVGSDHPTLPPARIADAFAALETADVAIGPSEDGGYYALGLRRAAWPAAEGLFRDVPWSTPEVLERTRRAVSALGLEAREIAPWYDVDEPADLERLRRDLDPASRTAEVLRTVAPEGREAGGRR